MGRLMLVDKANITYSAKELELEGNYILLNVANKQPHKGRRDCYTQNEYNRPLAKHRQQKF